LYNLVFFFKFSSIHLSLSFVFTKVASWSYFDEIPEDLKAAFQQIISQASSQMQGADLSQYLGNMEENYSEYLINEYAF
jgi:hypothetical protein